MQTLYLDISNKGVAPTVYAKQGDVGRKFNAFLTDSGVPCSLNGYAFSVWYEGDSGEGNYTDIGNKSAFSISGNIVSVEMITQMLSVPGVGEMCLVLSKPDGGQVSSWNIPYICEEVPGYGSGEAQEYYTAFSKAVADLPYPDASLSAAGKAADAAAVGAALAGKAPAGYGLGGAVKIEYAALDTTVKPGWYCFNQTISIHGALANFWYMLVISHADTNYTTQILYPCNGKNNELRRVKHVGIWGPWEWSNSPMELGTEYRTTERYNGKPVYVKTVRHTLTADTGSTSAATTLAINGNVSNVDSIVDVSGVYVGSDSKKYVIPSMGGSGNLFLGYNAVSNGNLYLVLVINKDVFKAGQYFNVTFKYTKTTD